jgi:lipoprotein-releasing system permease protein
MIQLALRYLLARRKQTILTLLGIFFGTAAYVAISGFMLGFREYMTDQLVNNNAHVHIQAREEFLSEHGLDDSFYGNLVSHVFWSVPPSGRKNSAMVENPQSWYKRLSADPRVVAFSPQLTAAVVIANGKVTVPSTIIGVDPIAQKKVTTIGNYITEGKFDDLAYGGNRLAIGDELKKKLGARLNQNVLVAVASGEKPSPFKISAFFKTGIRELDVRSYGVIGDIQRVNGTPNQVNEIAVKLPDSRNAYQLAADWSHLALEKVESWEQQNENFLNLFRIQDFIRFLSIGSILVVASFGIYNVLNMTVMQKRKDIAILRSMGYTTANVIFLFFSQGLILGICGAILGLGFGYVFCLYLQTIPFSGGPLGAGTGYLIVSFNPQIYVQALFLAFCSSSLASVLPALAAGRLTPIEIIRAGAE